MTNGGQWTGPKLDPSDPPLHDVGMLEEIDLLTDLIVAATATYGSLGQEQIDEILGVTVSRDSSPTAGGSAPGADMAEPRDQTGVGHEAH